MPRPGGFQWFVPDRLVNRLRIAAILLAVSLGGGTVLLWEGQIRPAWERDQRYQVDRLLEAYAAELARALAAGDYASLRRGVERILAEHDPVSGTPVFAGLELHERNGAYLFSNHRQLSQPPLSRFRGYSATVPLTRPEPADVPRAYLTLHYRGDRLRQVQEQVRWALFGALACLLLALFLLLRFVRWQLRPLERLTRELTWVKRDVAHRYLPSSPTRAAREIRTVYAVTAELLERIRRYTQELETRVAERTRSLDAEVAHRRQIQRDLEAIFDLSPVPLLVSRLRDGRLLKANAATFDFFGVTLEDQAGSLYTPDFYRNPQQREALVRRIQAGEVTIRDFELALQVPNGPRDVLLAMNRITYPEEPALLVAFTDITERKRLEATLRSSQKQLQDLVALAQDAILAFDETGRVTRFNHSAEAMFQMAAEEVLGRGIERLLPDLGQHLTEARRAGTALDRASGWELEALPVQGALAVEASVSVHHDRLGTQYTAILRDITDRKSRERVLYREATTDPLTGLLNRRSFTRRAHLFLEDACRDRRGVALVVLDIDWFKRINDQFGHGVGDRVIQRVAARVQEASVAEALEALVARLGGEEFAWLSAFEPAVAAQQVDPVRRAIEEDTLVTETGAVCRVTVSAGVTGLAPSQSLDGSAEFCLRRLLERADQLLYQAKRAGRNRILQEAIR